MQLTIVKKGKEPADDYTPVGLMSFILNILQNSTIFNIQDAAYYLSSKAYESSRSIGSLQCSLATAATSLRSAMDHVIHLTHKLHPSPQNISGKDLYFTNYAFSNSLFGKFYLFQRHLEENYFYDVANHAKHHFANFGLPSFRGESRYDVYWGKDNKGILYEIIIPTYNLFIEALMSLQNKVNSADCVSTIQALKLPEL
jgi:hypothetical protein